MQLTILAATNNQKKLAEIRRILETQGVTVCSLSQAGLDIDPEENGATFAENALIKANAVAQAARETGKPLPVLADDSGLAVDALGGAPGVYSARYAGAHGNDAANNAKLLQKLENTPLEKRTARFVSAVAFVWPTGETLQAEGSCEGFIGFEEKGDGGFGYDPLFYVNTPEGPKSYAQLTAEEKDAISHRGAALEKLGNALPSFLQSVEAEK